MRMSKRNQRYSASHVTNAEFFNTQKIAFQNNLLKPHHMENVERGSDNIILQTYRERWTTCRIRHPTWRQENSKDFKAVKSQHTF